MNEKSFSIFPKSRVWLAALAVLIILSACSVGTTGSQDEFLLHPMVPPSVPSGVICRDLAPSLTNPAITTWDEVHEICLPEAPNTQSGILWVFLPGTGATAADYNVLTHTAAESGLHAITLRYPNDKSVNLQHCPLDTDDDCHEKARHETLYGEDTSKHVDVNPDNSIEGRLLAALQYLQSLYPSEGWEQFLTKEGAIHWPAIAISGHSQGAGHAAFIAKGHRVHHAVLFAWVDIRRGELAPWLTAGDFQTPPEDFFLFWHEGDDKVTQHADKLMTALDLHTFGPSVVVDGRTAPFDKVTA